VTTGFAVENDGKEKMNTKARECIRKILKSAIATAALFELKVL
jgi:hypothetical protein